MALDLPLPTTEYALRKLLARRDLTDDERIAVAHKLDRLRSQRGQSNRARIISDRSRARHLLDLKDGNMPPPEDTSD